jgi:hypothetical protein
MLRNALRKDGRRAEKSSRLEQEESFQTTSQNSKRANNTLGLSFMLADTLSDWHRIIC